MVVLDTALATLPVARRGGGKEAGLKVVGDGKGKVK